jgi:hypothetical protein
MKHLLSSTAFLVVNKNIARALGLNASLLLSDLISKEAYFIELNQLSEGWFFNTEANIHIDTTLSPYQQRKSLKTLKKERLVEVKRMGIPAKQYFKINEPEVIKFLNNLSDKKPITINKNKVIRINNKIISNREAFVLNVLAFDYDKKILEGFIDYWTEPNKSNTKMKFELQQTWDTNLRLKTWAANQKKWDAPIKPSKNKLTKNTTTMKNVLNKLNGYD